MIEVIQSNALHIPLPDGVVQCVITSPPYFGLRDYGVSGQIGLEPTPEAYVANIVAVMRECWRVMREDATAWVNLGDSYASGGAGGDYGPGGLRDGQPFTKKRRDNIAGLKPKDLIGIPWRVAFALQADGWYLRSDIIWHKPNPMPESVTDRPTKSHEYVFLLAKQERYWYDAEAIKEPISNTTIDRFGSAAVEREGPNGQNTIERSLPTGKTRTLGADPSGRNRRTVWTIATSPYSGAHFATFPPALVEPMILAGTSPQACEHCGAAWERVTAVTGERDTHGVNKVADIAQGRHGSNSIFSTAKVNTIETTGWRPTCECPDNTGAGKCIVLDPFSGSGTVGRVCAKLGRSFVGGELNPAYIELAQHRTSGVQIAALL